MSAKLIITPILTGLVVICIAQNAQVAGLRFLIWTLAVSQALLLILVLAIGVIGGWVLRAWFTHRRSQAESFGEAKE
jgi:uncharacterized integral membrane protein